MDGDWTTPGCYEVAPGVYRIPLPLPNDGLRAVNVYALVTPDGPVLVDAGWSIPQARELLARALDGIGFGLADIVRFLVTHVHRDHYTHAVTLRSEFGTRVGLGAGERAGLETVGQPGWVPLVTQLEALRRAGAAGLADEVARLVAGSPHSDRSEWGPPDEWLEPGALPLPGGRILSSVATPGHTRGHLVFYDEAAGLLFAGDHVLPTITPSIGFEPVPSPNPLGDFLRSLAVVRARPDARLLPAHGPVAPSVHDRVDELLAHHDTRLGQVATAAERGADTAADVAGQLRWTRRERSLGDLDPFNRMLAITETAAHLDLLVAQGRLACVVDDGVRRYAAPSATPR